MTQLLDTMVAMLALGISISACVLLAVCFPTTATRLPRAVVLRWRRRSG